MPLTRKKDGLPDDKLIALGAVECRFEKIDTTEEIVARIEEAIKHVDPSASASTPTAASPQASASTCPSKNPTSNSKTRPKPPPASKNGTDNRPHLAHTGNSTVRYLLLCYARKLTLFRTEMPYYL